MGEISEVVILNAQKEIWESRNRLIDICENYTAFAERFEEVKAKKEAVINELREWGKFLQENNSDPKEDYEETVEKWIKKHT